MRMPESYDGRRELPSKSVYLWPRIFGRFMNSTKQKRYDGAYMRMAREWARLSHCQRKQVGALIVKDQMIIADGYNGAPSGFPNPCEDDGGDTHWYVLHAEANAITKLAKSNNSAAGATLYITRSPCRECAKLIHQAGIVRVVYGDAYKDTSGLDFLNLAGVEIVHLED
jgi:dCMP deaminase